MSINPRTVFVWVYDHVRHWNFFAPEVEEPDADRVIAVRHQLHSTRVYLLLFIVSLYVFFYVAMVQPQARTVVIDRPTADAFVQLHREHEQTLSCPCTNTFVLQQSFISQHVQFHPLCSSLFVRREWIEALYMPDGGYFPPIDLRGSAHAHFRLLSDFCSLTAEIVSQARSDIDRLEFVTVNLLSDEQVQSKVNGTAESVMNSALTRLASLVMYVTTNTRANEIVSSLYINTGVQVAPRDEQFLAGQRAYDYKDVTSNNLAVRCDHINLTMPSVLTTLMIYPPLSPPTLTVYELVDGFVAACSTIERVLLSALNCLTDGACVGMFRRYFPGLQHLEINLTDFLLPPEQDNYTFNHHLQKLLLDDWSVKVHFDKYFDQCAPTFCSYVTNSGASFYYALTILISLYGGFSIVLRLITPHVVTVIFNGIVRRRTPRGGHFSLVVPPLTRLRTYGQSLKQLNVFQTAADRTCNGIEQQRLNTRVFLLLLIGSFIILLCFHTFHTITTTITVHDPPLNTYRSLQASDENTLECPCSTMLIPYERFGSLSPVMHAICSSDFIREDWLLGWLKEYVYFPKFDWRLQASALFRVLADLCQLANETVADITDRFVQQAFVVPSMQSEATFRAEVNSTLNEFVQRTTTPFKLLVETTRLMMQVDQPYLGWNYDQTAMAETEPNLLVSPSMNASNEKFDYKVTFNLSGTHDPSTFLIDCICATDPTCENPARVRPYRDLWTVFISHQLEYMLPGQVERCSISDSLLFSNLECLYSNNDCYIYITSLAYQQVVPHHPSVFPIRPMVANPALDHFSPQAPIKTLVEELMVDRWEWHVSYEHFYRSCAPRYCTYTRRVRSKDALQVIIALISMLGGLIASLRTITPLLVKMFFAVKTILTSKRSTRVRVRHDHSTLLPFRQRMKTTFDKLFALARSELLDLNLFSARDFDSRLDRTTVKRLGQWATRLYLILLVASAVLLAFYTLLQPQPVTKVFHTPSLDLSVRLRHKYGDRLRCPCTIISTDQHDFLTLTPRFHPICHSPFAKDSWRVQITSGLVPHLSNYSRTDYRRFLSAHLQFLHGLCQQSMELVEDFVEQLHTTLFISTELLFEPVLRQRLHATIEQRTSNVSSTLVQILFVNRRVNQANGLVSTYATNFQYVFFVNSDTTQFATIQPFEYDGCSCRQRADCTSQATFPSNDSSTPIALPGLRIGCVPSEAFFASTLQCFYERSCLDLLAEYASNGSLDKSIEPLSSTNATFAMNNTIAQLVDRLFVEHWLTHINYTAYFDRCAPALCSFTSIQKFNLLYTVTLLLALQGGLTIVLSWICPFFVQLVMRAERFRQQRRNVVHPASTVGETTTVGSSTRCSRKTVLWSLLFIGVMATILITFSLYFHRSTTDHLNITTTISTTMDSTASTTSIPAACPMKFEPVATNIGDVEPVSPVLADFSNDSVADVIFFSHRHARMYVLLGRGNGTFREPLTFHVGPAGLWMMIAVGDLNNDQILDVVYTYPEGGHTDIRLGCGNGTFREVNAFRNVVHLRFMGIVLLDENADGILDIITIRQEHPFFGTHRGKGDGTFTYQWSLIFMMYPSYPRRGRTIDFDGNGWDDLVLINRGRPGINILLQGYNVAFSDIHCQIPYPDPEDVVVADLNSDTRLDLVIFSQQLSDLFVMFASHTACCRPGEMMRVERPSKPMKLASGDFNCDGHQDIAFGQRDPFRVSVFVGTGDERFRSETIYESDSTSDRVWIDAGHFNDDQRVDLIVIDPLAGTIVVLLNACQCNASANLSTNSIE